MLDAPVLLTPLAGIVTTPLDVLKTRLMTQGTTGEMGLRHLVAEAGQL
jgi:hypothetical protein